MNGRRPRAALLFFTALCVLPELAQSTQTGGACVKFGEGGRLAAILQKPMEWRRFHEREEIGTVYLLYNISMAKTNQPAPW